MTAPAFERRQTGVVLTYVVVYLIQQPFAKLRALRVVSARVEALENLQLLFQFVLSCLRQHLAQASEIVVCREKSKLGKVQCEKSCECEVGRQKAGRLGVLRKESAASSNGRSEASFQVGP